MLLLSFQNNIRSIRSNKRPSSKASFKNNENSQNLKKISRTDLSSEELLERTKNVIIGSHLAGTVILRRMVITIGTGVVKTNDPGIIV